MNPKRKLILISFFVLIVVVVIFFVKKKMDLQSKTNHPSFEELLVEDENYIKNSHEFNTRYKIAIQRLSYVNNPLAKEKILNFLNGSDLDKLDTGVFNAGHYEDSTLLSQLVQLVHTSSDSVLVVKAFRSLALKSSLFRENFFNEWIEKNNNTSHYYLLALVSAWKASVSPDKKDKFKLNLLNWVQSESKQKDSKRIHEMLIYLVKNFMGEAEARELLKKLSFDQSIAIDDRIFILSALAQSEEWAWYVQNTDRIFKEKNVNLIKSFIQLIPSV
jgi:hypothetical protein